MKKVYAILTAFVLTIAAGAQTLNVKVGDVVYQFPAAQTGEMTYSEGTTLTVMGKTFTLADVSSMTVDDAEVTDNQVSVVYGTSSATVYVAGNVAQYVEPTISGAHVTIAQSNTDAVDEDEITYQLSGSTSNGSFNLDGSYKSTVSLAGVTLTNPSGAAINITNKKRIQLSAKSNTENTLTDGAGGSQKACIYSKGQLQLQGKGTLNVVGNTKHAIKSASYISIKNLTLNITSTEGDGINCEEYLLMKSGTVTLSGIGDDGIQCDLGDADNPTGETEDHEDEDTGNIYLEGGTLAVTITAKAAKGIKSEGDIIVSDGTITVKSTGTAVYDSDDAEVKSSSCISSDGNITISGGTVTVTNSGAGGKGIKSDGTLTVSDDANVNATTTGAIAYVKSASNTTIQTATSTEDKTIESLDDDYMTSPKAIKADGNITISGGTVTASAAYHEAIESKAQIYITGGYIYSYSGDDAINSAAEMYITGGYVFANSSGNDGLDSNGNMYISGGTIIAVGKSEPEVGIDVIENGTLSITGGNIIAIGGLENTDNVTGTCYQASSYSKGSWYGLKDGSGNVVTAFKVPSNSSMGTLMVVYTSGNTPQLYSGVTTSGTAYWNGYGYSSFSGNSSVSLSEYTSSGMGGGDHPGGGGGQPGGGQPGGGGR